MSTINYKNEVSYETLDRENLIGLCNEFDDANDDALAEHFYNREMEAYNADGKDIVRDENGYIIPIVFYSEDVTEDEESSEEEEDDVTAGEEDA